MNELSSIANIKKNLSKLNQIALLGLMIFAFASGSMITYEGTMGSNSLSKTKNISKQAIRPVNVKSGITKSRKNKEDSNTVVQSPTFGSPTPTKKNNIQDIPPVENSNQSINHIVSPGSNNNGKRFSNLAQTNQISLETDPLASINLNSYKKVSPIYIDGDFALYTYAYTNNATGSGSISNPYTFDHYLINANYSNDPFHIVNTGSCFVFENSIFEAAAIGSVLNNVACATFLNDTFAYSELNGIRLGTGNQTYLENNTFYGIFQYSIVLNYGQNNFITYNKIYGSDGIYATNGDGNWINYNEIYSTVSDSIYLFSESNALVIANKIMDAKVDAIYAYNSPGSSINQNNIINTLYSGIDVYNSINIQIDQNQINNTNGNDGIDLNNVNISNIETNFIYNTYNAIICYQCVQNNIDGNEIAYVNNFGIEIYNANQITSTTNFIDYSYIGIYIDNSSFIQINTNYIYDITISGILIDSTNYYVTLSQNDIEISSAFGIEVYIYNNNTTILENYIANCNSIGISMNAYNIATDIEANTILYGLSDGININTDNAGTILYGNLIASNSGNGIWIASGNYTLISSNTIYNNGLSGIDTHITGGEISSNEIYNNSQNGIYVDYNTQLSNVSYNTLYDNGISGIGLSSTSSNLVYLNKNYNNKMDGISVWSGYNNTIKNNTVYANYGMGIFAQGSNNTYEFNNISFGINEGFGFLDATNNTLYDNHVEQNGYWGVSIVDSPLNYILNNVLIKDGFYLSSVDQVNYYQISVTGNTVNGKPILLANGLNGGQLVTTGYGQIILFNSNGVEITGYTQSDTDIGILLAHTTNLNIHGVTLANNTGYGMVFEYSNFSVIQYNSIYGNKLGGVLITKASMQNAIVSDTIYNNEGAGLSFYQSDENSVVYNTFTSNNYGIVIDSSKFTLIKFNNLDQTLNNGLEINNATNNDIYNNTILNSGINGLYIHTGSNKNDIENNTIENSYFSGLTAQNTENNVFKTNLFMDSSNYGLYFNHTSITEFSQNIVTNNGNDGLYMLNSSSNTFEQNIFNNNGIDGIQISSSLNNTFMNNELAFNREDGFAMYNTSSSNLLILNNVYNNSANGILLQNSDSNNIIQNFISSNHGYGLNLQTSTNNTLNSNVLNIDGLLIFGDKLSDFSEYSIQNNTVNGKPLYIVQNQNYITISQDVGQIIIINSSNIQITGESISNTDTAILVFYSNKILIYNNTFINNGNYGVAFAPLSNNSIVEWNNFINNKNFDIGSSQAYDSGFNNTFTHNYWSNEIKINPSENGICSFPYSINSNINNQDNYPLLAMVGESLLSSPAFINSLNGLTVNGTVKISWSGVTSLLNDSLHYELYISADNGSSWTLLANEITSTNYPFDTLVEPNGQMYKLMIVVIDDASGQRMQDISGNSFSIKNVLLSQPILNDSYANTTVNGAITITWTGSVSLLNDPLHYELYISADNGSSWVELADFVTGTSLNFNTMLVPNGNQYKIMIITVDDTTGQSVRYIEQESFSILNTNNSNPISTHNSQNNSSSQTITLTSGTSSTTNSSASQGIDPYAIGLVSVVGLAGISGLIFWRKKRK